MSKRRRPTESGLYHQPHVDPLTINLERMPDCTREIYDAVMSLAATAESHVIAMDALQLAYHHLDRMGGTPEQRRRMMRVARAMKIVKPAEQGAEVST